MSDRFSEAVAAGQAAYDARDFERAARAFAEAAGIRAANPGLLTLYADCARRTGDAEAAWSALRRALIIDPAHQKAAAQMAMLMVRTGRKDSEGLVHRAQRLKRQAGGKGGLVGRLAGVLGGRAAAPDLPGMTPAQAEAFTRAQGALAGGDFFSALVRLRPLSRELAGDARVQRARAEANLGIGEFAPARDALEAAQAAGADGDADLSFRALQIRAVVLGMDLDGAARMLDALAKADRAAPDILLAEARLHVAAGRTQAALDTVTRLEAVDDSRAAAASIQARLLAGMGRFEEALPWAEAWALRAPRSSAPMGFAAASRLLTLQSPLYEAATRLVDDPEVSQMMRAGAYFALWRAHEDAGDHAAAFDFLEKANIAADVAYDVSAEEAEAAAIKAAIPPGMPSAAPVPDAERARGEGMILVCGLPRSGSTLVAQILAAHSDCVSVGESQAFARCLDRAREAGYPGAPEGLDPAFLAELGETYLGMLPEAARGAAFVVDKDLGKFRHLGLVRMMLPGARIVHTRRDPMDVCYSMYCQNFAGWPAVYRYETLAHLHALHDDLMGHWARVLPQPPHVVRYEDMVADSEAETRRLLDAVGMPFHPDCLNFHEAASGVGTASVHQVRQKVYGSAVGAWKRHETALAPLRDALVSQGVAVG